MGKIYLCYPTEKGRVPVQCGEMKIGKLFEQSLWRFNGCSSFPFQENVGGL